MLWPSLIPKLRKIYLLNACFVSAVVLALNGLLLAQLPGQKTFASPEEAAQALFAAAKGEDQETMLDIFGPDGKEIVSTGDSVQDQNQRDQFVANYKDMHRLVQGPDRTTTLYIGADNWPFPVPLVYESGVWYFDTEAGEKEILYRRIGENELAVIDICHELVDAQNEYHSQPRDGEVQQYARTFASDEGLHNGLFWEATDNEPESPIGPLLANAASAVYGDPHEKENIPFYGYYYRILTGQGKTAPGGAKSYIVKGKMTGGFAILAYPADYGSSGVMTFIVNRTGVIYQKDLGAETAELATAISEYAPDDTWKKAE